LYTFTDAAGNYRLAPVAPGEIHLRIAAIATRRRAPPSTLADSAGADFTLEPRALEAHAARRREHQGAPVRRAGTSVAQLTEQEIARRAVNTVDEAVDKAAGVQISTARSTSAARPGYVQGLNSRVLLLVDGVPMNQGDRGGDQLGPAARRFRSSGSTSSRARDHRCTAPPALAVS